MLFRHQQLAQHFELVLHLKGGDAAAVGEQQLAQAIAYLVYA